MKFYFRSSTPPNALADNKSCCTSTPDCSKQAIPPPKPPAKSSCPGSKPITKKKKIDFKALKKDTICSLHEVEHFLCNFQNISKYIKLFKILK